MATGVLDTEKSYAGIRGSWRLGDMVYGHVFMQRQRFSRSIIILEKVNSITSFLRMHVVNFGVITYVYHCFAKCFVQRDLNLNINTCYETANNVKLKIGP